jgi:hypothetical protein
MDRRKNGDPGPRSKSKRLTGDEREQLIRHAMTVWPMALSPYQVATEVMKKSTEFGSSREPITRRVAQSIFQAARTRLHADMGGVRQDGADHVLWKVRELYARARQGTGGTLMPHHYKTLVSLIQLEHDILVRGQDQAAEERPITNVDFEIFDPGVTGSAGDGSGSPGGACDIGGDGTSGGDPNGGATTES